MSDANRGRAADLWERWEAPDMDGGAARRAAAEAALALPTAEQLEALRQGAYEEGFTSGRAEGLAAGTAEVQARGDQLAAMIRALARPLDQIDARVEEELVALTIALTRQLVRREIQTDPGVVVAAIREALGVLPLAAREVAVKLHPDDAALVREVFADRPSESRSGWAIVESPAITRGGCVVVTSTSQVDATVERRLNAAIRHVFGGERVSDGRAAEGTGAGGNP